MENQLDFSQITQPFLQETLAKLNYDKAYYNRVRRSDNKTVLQFIIEHQSFLAKQLDTILEEYGTQLSQAVIKRLIDALIYSNASIGQCINRSFVPTSFKVEQIDMINSLDLSKYKRMHHVEEFYDKIQYLVENDTNTNFFVGREKSMDWNMIKLICQVKKTMPLLYKEVSDKAYNLENLTYCIELESVQQGRGTLLAKDLNIVSKQIKRYNKLKYNYATFTRALTMRLHGEDAHLNRPLESFSPYFASSNQINTAIYADTLIIMLNSISKANFKTYLSMNLDTKVLSSVCLNIITENKELLVANMNKVSRDNKPYTLEKLETELQKYEEYTLI